MKLFRAEWSDSFGLIENNQHWRFLFHDRRDRLIEIGHYGIKNIFTGSLSSHIALSIHPFYLVRGKSET